jgi:hypothetical protein
LFRRGSCKAHTALTLRFSTAWHEHEPAPMMSTVPVFHRSPHVVYQELAGEEGAVLLNLDTGVYFGLNPVGARIWELLENPRSEAQLQASIAEEFEVDPDVALTDVREFLAGLNERSLLGTGGAG